MEPSKVLNNDLIKRQGLNEDTVKKIESLHEEMEALKQLPFENIENISDYVLDMRGLEYEMQWRWGFTQDSNYHTHWFMDHKCFCPVLDNQDRLGTPYNVIALSCPLHGDKPANSVARPLQKDVA